MTPCVVLQLVSKPLMAYDFAMSLSIEFRGQLALATKSAKITCEVPSGTGVAALLKDLAEKESEEFRKLILDDAGECGSTLFIAIDGEHIRIDPGVVIPDNARDMVVMPPIAGG